MLAMSYFKVEGPCAAEGSVPFGRALLGWCPRRRSAARLRSRPHSSAAPVDQRCPTTFLPRPGEEPVAFTALWSCPLH